MGNFAEVSEESGKRKEEKILLLIVNLRNATIADQ